MKCKKLPVICIALAVFAAGVISAPVVNRVTHKILHPHMSQEEVLQELVQDAKSKIELPHKNDEHTTLVDLRADTSDMSVVYQIEVRGLAITDEAAVKRSIRKDLLKMCGQEDTQAVLRGGLHFKWIHHFVEADKAFTTVMGATDCKL